MNKILVIGFKGMYNSSKMLVDILSIFYTKGFLPQISKLYHPSKELLFTI